VRPHEGPIARDMRGFLYRYRVLILLLLLAMVGMHSLSLHLAGKPSPGPVGKIILDIWAPIIKVTSYPLSKISKFFSSYLFLVNVKERNQVLERENSALKAELARVRESELEGIRCREMLGFSQLIPKQLAAARVISRSLFSEFRTVDVDKGTYHGVQEGMVAMAPSGLVGYISSSSTLTSKVRLITDVKSAVDAVIQRTRANAIVKGYNSNLCVLKYLDNPLDVIQGDMVVSSGMGGVFPKGILVGTVSEVKKSPEGVLVEIFLKPSVDMEKLEELWIVPKMYETEGNKK